jgi:hypothetical protein
MDQERLNTEGVPPVPNEAGPDWAMFIQQQVQNVFQAAIPHIVQQISERATPPLPTPLHDGETAVSNSNLYQGEHHRGKALKVAKPDKFTGKKGGEVYKWFAQLRLVFRSNPDTYNSDEDKVAYALSYLTGAAQNWAMPILQALDEGRSHDLLHNYEAFRRALVAVYGEIDRRGNAEDRLANIRQTGAVANYISTFNEHAAQVEWNEPSLVARFRAGLKDDLLDSIATAETQPRTLQEWMSMASRIDDRLWTRQQHRRPTGSTSAPREYAARSRPPSMSTGPTPMELDATYTASTALAKTAADRLEYQRQGRCWGCGKMGHIRSRCPTNPSKPLTLAATDDEGSGKGAARD